VKPSGHDMIEPRLPLPQVSWLLYAKTRPCPPRAAAAMFNGWVTAHSGKISEGILLVEQGLSAWQRIGIQHFLPRNHCLLAEAYLAGQRYTEALTQVSLAFKAVEKTGVRYK
jgi:predicted ATPase